MNVGPQPSLKDRRPPHNAEAERNLLGAILIESSHLKTVEQAVSASDFFCRAHARIFTQMQRLVASGQPVDLVTLYDSLQPDPEIAAVGGVAYLAKLGEGVYNKAPVAEWAKIVRDAAYLRTVAHAGDSLTCAALEPRAEVGHVADQVQALLKSLNVPPTSSKTSLVAVSVEELLAREIKPREMLLDPILPEQGLAMLYSFRGIGKTFLSLAIAAAVASGGRFLRWTAPRARAVLYVDGELPAKTVQERTAMILAGLEGAEPPANMLRIITPDFQSRPLPDLATLEGQKLLEPHLERVALVVFDNLSALCRYGNENEGEGWLPMQEWALSLRRRGISVLFDHHAGKNRSQRGTSRREDLLDTVITLKHPPDYNPSEGLRCEVHFEKTRAMLGEAAKPFEVRMQQSLKGQAIWTTRDLEDSKGEQAAELFAAGMSVRDVAEELGISKSAAGRLRNKGKANAASEVSHCPTI